jgi:flagellar basal body rod protein FlgF
MEIKTGAKLDVTSKADCTLKADGKISVTSNGSEIGLTCGGGSVVVKQDGSITIKGTQIKVDASAQLTLQSSGVVKVSGSQIMLG